MVDYQGEEVLQGGKAMTKNEHKKRHENLHKAFDELLADWIANTQNLPSKTTVLQLMEWSHKQELAPDHDSGEGSR